MRTRRSRGRRNYIIRIYYVRGKNLFSIKEKNHLIKGGGHKTVSKIKIV